MLRVLREFYNNKTKYFFYILFLVVSAIFCLIAVNFFLDITYDLKAGDIDQFDESVTSFIYSFRSDALTSFVIPITEMGSQWAYLIVIPIITFVLYRKGHSWRLALQSFIILLSTFFLNLGIKYLISRPRPVLADRLVEVGEGSFSYPSGHSMSAMAFYGFLIYLTFRLVKHIWLRWVLVITQLLLIFLIGTSRVYLGVHYPSDVIAGFIGGLIWLAICLIALRSFSFFKWRRKVKLERTK